VTAVDVGNANAAGQGGAPPVAEPMPPFFFALEIFYLFALAFLVVFSQQWAQFHHLIPDPIGPIPLSVVWWGAFGATLMGCYGVFFHNHDWNPDYNYWYMARPVTGAAVGAAAYLLFVIAIQTTGLHPKTTGTLGYDAVAFLVGFSEKSFQALVARAAAVVFGPGGGQPNQQR
jgi:hypothetical protein